MSCARPAWLKVVFALILCANWIGLASASEVRTLQNIEVVSAENLVQVMLEFNDDYLGDPLVNFESGSISIRLDSVSKDSELPLLTYSESDSFLKAVRAFQIPNTNLVHLDFLPRSSRVELEHPKITHSGNILQLSLPASIAVYPALSNTNVLTAEIEKRINADKSFPSTFSKVLAANTAVEQTDTLLPFPAKDWTETILTMVLSLLFVLLLIYLIAFLYNRFFSGRFSAMQGKISIRQVSSYHVGPKQKVIVFEMNGRLFACGVTPTSINLIAELQSESEQDFLQTLETDEKTNELNVDHTQANNLKYQSQGNQKNDSTVSQYAANEKDTPNTLDFVGMEKGVFLKPNVENENSRTETKNNKNGHKSQARLRSSKSSAKTEKMSFGNQIMQDFGSKLSDRIKFLKPIK